MLFAITRKLTEIEEQAQFLINQAKQIKLAKVLLDQALSSLSDAVNVAKETTPDIVDLLKEDIVENLNALLNIDVPAPEVTEAIAPEVTEAIAPEVTELELEAEGFELVEDEVKPEVSTDETETKQLDLVEAIAEHTLFKIQDIVAKTDKNQRGFYAVIKTDPKKGITLVPVKRLAKFNQDQEPKIYSNYDIYGESIIISPQEIQHYKSSMVIHNFDRFGIKKIIHEFNPIAISPNRSIAYHIMFEGTTYNEVFDLCERFKNDKEINQCLISVQYTGTDKRNEIVVVSFTLEAKDTKFEEYNDFENAFMQVAYIHDKNKKETNNEALIAPNNEIHADQVVIADPDGQFPSYYYVETLNGDKASVQNCYIDEYGGPLFTRDAELYDLRIETLAPLLTQCSSIVKATQEVNCIEKAYKQEYNSKLIAIHLYIKSKKSHLTKILKDWEIKYLMTESLLEQSSKGVYAVRLFNIKDYDQLMAQILSLDSLIERCEKIAIPKPKTKQEDSPEDHTEEMPF